MDDGAGEEASLLRRWFEPSVFRNRGTAEAAARDYEQNVVGVDSATVRYNVGTALTPGGTERGGIRMPARDFIIASAGMQLDNNEPVYVTTCWRWAADLESRSTGSTVIARPGNWNGQWVEQRSLRFGDPLDTPENVMIVDRPCICRKPYMRVSFFAMGLLPRPPSSILLIGLGAGHLVEIWRTHLPRAPGAELAIHCVELHGEVVDLARKHFDFCRAADAQTTVNVQVGDGRLVLEQLPPSSYDLVVVDLPVAGLVDDRDCANLRRVLRPTGVCVHNYNFASGQDVPATLPAHFSEVHQLVIDASNTILASTTMKVSGDDDFGKLIDKAMAVQYVPPLPFDLRADLEAVAHGLLMASDEEANAVLKTDLATRCGPIATRGNDILKRVQAVGNVFTAKLKECSQQLSDLRVAATRRNQACGTEDKERSSTHIGCSSRVEVVQQVLLRKVLAVDRGQAATLARSINAMLDSVAELAEEKDGSDAKAAPSALVRLAELNSMLNTAAMRLEKLEDRATQLQNGIFEQLLSEGFDADTDTDTDSGSETDSGSGQEDRKTTGQVQDTLQISSQHSQNVLAELRETAEVALADIMMSASTTMRRPGDVYTALARSLTRK